jgi:predicted dehydrogenase
VIDLVIGILGSPAKVTSFAKRTANFDDQLVDNMLAVFDYPKATATVKSTALEVSGFDRRHLVVCGTEGTFHIQPLDNPAARLALSKGRGDFRTGYQDLSFPKYSRYVDDAADMARIIRGEKSSDFSYEHDLSVQAAVLQASGVEGPKESR